MISSPHKKRPLTPPTPQSKLLIKLITKGTESYSLSEWHRYYFFICSLWAPLILSSPIFPFNQQKSKTVRRLIGRVLSMPTFSFGAYFLKQIILMPKMQIAPQKHFKGNCKILHSNQNRIIFQGLKGVGLMSLIQMFEDWSAKPIPSYFLSLTKCRALQFLKQRTMDPKRIFQGKEAGFDWASSKISRQEIEVMGEKVVNENRIEVEMVDHRVQELELIKHYVVQEGGQLVRITEIHVEDRVIKIRDSFTSPHHLQYDTTIIVHKPVGQSDEQTQLLLERSLKLNKEKVGVKRDQEKTKEKVKEIFQLFLRWVEQHTMGQLQLGKALRQLKTSHRRYDCKLFQKIQKNPVLKKAFQTFNLTSQKGMVVEHKHPNQKTDADSFKKSYELPLRVNLEQVGKKDRNGDSNEVKQQQKCRG